MPSRCRLLAVLLLAAAGCNTQNPAYFPFWWPAGDVERTHAKPGGHGYFADFDPHAVRLVVRPVETLSPTRTQQVIIATVYDEHDQPRRGRRVEWSLEGVGQILEVDESGYHSGRGYKDDARSAVSYTDTSEHTFNRGTDDPSDDFTIRPGQSWCVVSAAQEGTTQITVFAPEIYNWNARKVTVTLHWVDTQCVVPPPAVLRAGTQYQLSTTVKRRSDGQPQANYRVRYRLLDGPPARLVSASGSAAGDPSEAVAISDATGTATVTLSQREAKPGVNRIAVEVVRMPGEPGGAEVVVGQGETKLEWQSAAIGLTVNGPPAAMVGREVPLTLTVRGTGAYDTPPVTVRQKVPPGWKFVRSEPPATPDGEEVVWTLGGLTKDGSQSIQAVFVPSGAGTVTATAVATTTDGLSAESQTPINIAAGQLKLALVGPATAAVGDLVKYQFTVTNTGTGPVAKVLLQSGFGAGLEHESKLNPLELDMGSLAAGQSQTVPLELTAKQAGQWTNTALVVGEGGLKNRAEIKTEVRARQVVFTLGGPERVYAGTEATWEMKVTNGGEVPLANALVRLRLPPQVEFARASADGRHQPADGTVVWYLGTLPPHEGRTLQLTCMTRLATAKALTSATATADGLSPQPAEHSLEILGVPALTLDISQRENPVEINGTAHYTIRVTNRGTLPADQVELTITASGSLKLIRGNGPTAVSADAARAAFAPSPPLAPGQSLEYVIDAQALAAGDAPLKVEVKSPTLTAPVAAVEVTRVLQPAGRP